MDRYVRLCPCLGTRTRTHAQASAVFVFLPSISFSNLVGISIVSLLRALFGLIVSMPLSVKIAPSLLSGDFANLAHEAQTMIDFGSDYLHMDVMDG